MIIMKVLHILHGLNVGGAEAFLKNLSKSFANDDIQMDFLLRSSQNDSETVAFFEKQGADIYIVSAFPRHFIKNRYETISFLKEYGSRYDVIHIHANSLFYYLPVAVCLNKLKNKKIIVHCHSTAGANKLVHIIHFFNKIRLALNHNVTRLACGVDAGYFMFGGSDYSVVPNAIDLKSFMTPETNRKAAQHTPNSGGVLLSVGRLVAQKNHLFLIDVMREVVKIKPSVQLWICGEGHLRAELEKNIDERGLGKNIRLLGNRSDIAELLQQADVYLMPSTSEGLGIAAIEAQASGTPCIFSDKIPQEAILAKNVSVIPLEKDAWVSGIIQTLQNGKFEYGNIDLLEQAGYGLNTLRNKMIDIYNR